MINATHVATDKATSSCTPPTQNPITTTPSDSHPDNERIPTRIALGLGVG